MKEKVKTYLEKTSSVVAFFTTDLTRTDIKRNLDLCCKSRQQNASNRGMARFCVFWENDFFFNFHFSNFFFSDYFLQVQNKVAFFHFKSFVT